MAVEYPVEVWPRNWLKPVALVTLREESSYGYELMKRLTTEFGFEELNPGSLYRNLRRMEQEGLCKSEWEASFSSSENGSANRMYSITEEGEAFLETWVEACEQYRRVMGSLSQAYRKRHSAEQR